MGFWVVWSLFKASEYRPKRRLATAIEAAERAFGAARVFTVLAHHGLANAREDDHSNLVDDQLFAYCKVWLHRNFPVLATNYMENEINMFFSLAPAAVLAPATAWSIATGSVWGPSYLFGGVVFALMVLGGEGLRSYERSKAMSSFLIGGLMVAAEVPGSPGPADRPDPLPRGGAEGEPSPV